MAPTVKRAVHLQPGKDADSNWAPVTESVKVARPVKAAVVPQRSSLPIPLMSEVNTAPTPEGSNDNTAGHEKRGVQGDKAAIKIARNNDGQDFAGHRLRL